MPFICFCGAWGFIFGGAQGTAYGVIFGSALVTWLRKP